MAAQDMTSSQTSVEDVKMGTDAMVDLDEELEDSKFDHFEYNLFVSISNLQGCSFHEIATKGKRCQNLASISPVEIIC